MQPSPSKPGSGRTADTCPKLPGLERPAAARAPAAAFSLEPASASRRTPRGLDMSAQETPQGRRLPLEAGDSPGLAAAPESQDSPEQAASTLPRLPLPDTAARAHRRLPGHGREPPGPGHLSAPAHGGSAGAGR
ncbi:protein FAM229A isoform X1 [Manis pentadactyla]|uniref:protein FAM229A isoform X1 n=1 Tax=Manis pentadactyla TaxID=143292 RepID=UPI00255CD1E4|nr:protein FAM229A isoform X1 [Manis pentadactyla]